MMTAQVRREGDGGIERGSFPVVRTSTAGALGKERSDQ
jgi:hypothetical protein